MRTQTIHFLYLLQPNLSLQEPLHNWERYVLFHHHLYMTYLHRCSCMIDFGPHYRWYYQHYEMQLLDGVEMQTTSMPSASFESEICVVSMEFASWSYFPCIQRTNGFQFEIVSSKRGNPKFVAEWYERFEGFFQCYEHNDIAPSKACITNLVRWIFRQWWFLRAKSIYMFKCGYYLMGVA
jgi:hypothetical protein